MGVDMIAIIPARGGSKGVPGKNIKELCGKPLIAYTIEAAKSVKEIERVIVNTDDVKIAEVAKKYGAEVPFMRPEYLATDTAAAPDVYIHAIETLMQESDVTIDKFMVLLPTAPFRSGKHIKEAMELFYKEKAETLVSMNEAEIPVSWYFQKDEMNRVHNANFGKNEAMLNRQIATTYYRPNGAIYILDYQLLKEKRSYYSENTVAYIMSEEDSIDIDTMLDFEIAKVLMNNKVEK